MMFVFKMKEKTKGPITPTSFIIAMYDIESQCIIKIILLKRGTKDTTAHQSKIN